MVPSRIGEESEAEAGADFLAGEIRVFWSGHPDSPARFNQPPTPEPRPCFAYLAAITYNTVGSRP
jgi:hypothetical protein